MFLSVCSKYPGWGRGRLSQQVFIVSGAGSPRSRGLQRGLLLVLSPWLADRRPLPVWVCVLNSFYKDIRHIGLGLTLKPSFNLMISLKTLSPNTITF